MIKDLFLPTKIGNTYLFPQRIVAFELGGDTIRATKILAHRSLATLSTYIEEPYNPSKPESVIHALTVIKEKFGKWDVTYVCLPSSRAIFKRLSLPFTNRNKIRLVLPFELESVLPFAVQDAVFDVVATPSKSDPAMADVFVATIKKDVLDAYIQPFLDLGIIPQRVTLGGIELYGFIHTLNNPLTKTGPVIVVDIDTTSTDVLLIANGQLISMRTIPRGIDIGLLQRAVSSLIPDEQVAIDLLISELRFTIQALTKNEHLDTVPTNLLITGAASQMEDLAILMQERLNMTVSLLHPHDIMQIPWVNMDHQGVIPGKFIKSFAAALPHSITEQFDLGLAYHEAKDLSNFKKKFFTATGLVVLLFGLAIISSMMSTSKLKKELNSSRLDLEKQLIAEFKLTRKPGATGIKALIDEAQKRLSVNEGVWSALTTDRYSFLTYLQALSTHINRDEIGLELKKLTIKRDPQTGEDRISLEGGVKDYNALRMLETELLETKIFKSVPRQQETKFTLSLTVNKEGDFR